MALQAAAPPHHILLCHSFRRRQLSTLHAAARAAPTAAEVQRPGKRQRVREAQHPQRHISVVLICHEVLRAVLGHHLGQGLQPVSICGRGQGQAVAEQQAGQQGRPQGRGRHRALAQLRQQRRDAAPFAGRQRGLRAGVCMGGAGGQAGVGEHGRTTPPGKKPYKQPCRAASQPNQHSREQLSWSREHLAASGSRLA